MLLKSMVNSMATSAAKAQKSAREIPKSFGDFAMTGACFGKDVLLYMFSRNSTIVSKPLL